MIQHHYYKHDKKEVKDTIDWIKGAFGQMLEDTDNIKKVLAAEGDLWQRFYATFQYYLPEDFIMNKRVKRPPPITL